MYRDKITFRCNFITPVILISDCFSRHNFIIWIILIFEDEYNLPVEYLGYLFFNILRLQFTINNLLRSSLFQYILTCCSQRFFISCAYFFDWFLKVLLHWRSPHLQLFMRDFLKFSWKYYVIIRYKGSIISQLTKSFFSMTKAALSYKIRKLKTKYYLK